MLPPRIFIWLIFSASLLTASAQMPGWLYRDALMISNPNTAQAGHTMLMYINTQALVASGKMQSSGNDLRFSSVCDGSTPLDYWIESGMGTSRTMIWVRVPALPANDSTLIYMFYGNPTAPAVSDFDLAFPNRRIVTGIELITDSLWRYDYVEISFGAKLVLHPDHNGRFVIQASKVLIADSLIGLGSGYEGGTAGPGAGPGGGDQSGGTATSGGGGGGYGGSGGNGGGTNAGKGGQAYGTSGDLTIDKGSGGGKGFGSSGGAGGGCFDISATEIIVSGSISAGGLDGLPNWYSGGGGSGGGILLKGQKIKVSGSLSAKGGNGGLCPSNSNGGGGGGGGRIKIFFRDSCNFSGTFNVLPGVHQSTGVIASPGLSGSFYNAPYPLSMPTYRILPHVSLDVSQNPVCEAVPVTFTANGENYDSFNFIVNGVSRQNSPAQQFTTDLLADGSKIIIVATDANNCPDTSNVITMVILPRPLLVITGKDTVCQGDSLLLTATGGVSYSWSTGAAAPVIKPKVLSDTTFTLFGTGTNDCQGSVSIAVVASMPVTAHIEGDSLICEGDEVRLVASGGSSFSWNTGESSSEITAIPASATTYEVIVRSDACADTISHTIEVAPAINLSITGDQEICAGEQTILHASGASSYFWNTGESSPTISLSPLTTTTYTLNAASGPCTAALDVIITVLPAIAAYAGQDVMICRGDSIQLSAAGGSTYNWTPSIGLSDAQVADPKASPQQTTVYRVEAVSPEGCTDADEITVAVELCNGVSAPVAHQVVVYPNPSEGIIHIEIPAAAGPVSVFIHDITGRIAFEGQMSCSSQCSLDISSLSPGLYTIRVLAARQQEVFSLQLK